MQKYIVQYRDDKSREEFQSYFDADDFGHAEEQAKDYSNTPIVEIKLDTRVFYLHKFEVEQCYGGPEEGGWWYDSGVPTGEWVGPFLDEELAYAACRDLNEKEHERSENEEEYGYTSVLSHRSQHFAWDVSDEKEARPYPEVRPHYE